MFVDVQVFVFILIITYFGFAEAFLRLSDASASEGKFLDNYAHALLYTFRLSMGDMSTDTFNSTVQPVTVWLIFIACLAYSNIVLLNLLIAIISESFAFFNSNQEQASY